MNTATYTVLSQSEAQLVVHQSETATRCGDRYTLTPDGVVRDVKNRKLSINARVVRGAVYAIASKAGFKFVAQPGAY